jgi:SAM-dependent methyltransferase
MPAPPHLTPSELGTKSYWDTAYTLELTNYTTNTTTDDEGTVWFSDAGAEERMLAFLENLSDEGVLRKEVLEEVEEEEKDVHEGDVDDEDYGVSGKVEVEDDMALQATRFLDLGTGNGHLLFALREEEWEGEMVGVDYSGKSVALARSIAARKGEEYQDIRFEEWDLLAQPPGEWLAGGFDVVLDKGTFDAICLSQETDAQGRRICEGYREKVEGLVKKGGRFLITSCNWTEDELRGWFEGEGSTFVYEDKVKYPSFTFGGKTGSSVVTLCFKRS